jgi:hypothetical protein
MLTDHQKKHDRKRCPKDRVQKWLLKRKKYPPPTEEYSECYSRPENSSE